MPALGFDISDDSVRALELTEKNGVYQVGFHTSARVPKGIISGGEILNPVKLQEMLRAIQRRHRFVFVNASLPEQKSYLFTTTVKGSAASIQQNIEFNLEENVPLRANEAVFDYEIFRSYRKQGSAHRDVKVSVVSRHLSESYTALLRRAGLRPLSLMVESEAVARAIIPENDNRTFMTVDLGKTRTGISVVSEGVVLYTSTIEIGGAHLTEGLAQKLNIPLEVAEEQKQKHGLWGEGEATEASRILREKLQMILGQIEHHMRYWHTQVDERGIHSKRIETILLCGGGALMRGITAEFKTVFSTHTELANVWSNVPFRQNYIPGITFEESLSFATAIGLALKE